MTFTHDTAMALQAAVFLVNTAEEPDTLPDVAALDAFYEEFGYTGRHERSREELDAVRRLRGELRGLLLAARDDSVDVVNAWLAEAGAVPRLVRHEGYDWHLHATGPADPLDRRIRVETAMAMIDVIRADEHSRITVCDAEDCAALVLDLSRNRSRRFCSTTCGNRVAVAAYRARQAEDAQTGD